MLLDAGGGGLGALEQLAHAGDEVAEALDITGAGEVVHGAVGHGAGSADRFARTGGDFALFVRNQLANPSGRGNAIVIFLGHSS